MRLKLTFNINTKEVTYSSGQNQKKTFKSYYTYLKAPFEAPEGKEFPVNINFRQDCENPFGRNLNGVITAIVDVPWYLVYKKGKTDKDTKEAEDKLYNLRDKYEFALIWIHKILDYKPFEKKEKNDADLLEFNLTQKTKDVENIKPTDDGLPF